jgi:ABC-type lipoprotein export system ATPase subunit
MIMVTHNPDLAARYASRTIQLVDGRVVSAESGYRPVGARQAAADASGAAGTGARP